jgi:hypothetical protein
MTKICFTICFLSTWLVTICFSQSTASPIKGTWTNSGLEVQNVKQIPVWVTPIDETTKKMGLTDERIKTKCEFKIRQMKLEPVDFRITYPPQPYQLMISIQATESSFLVELTFLRRVNYEVGGKLYEIYAPTWLTNGFGTHGNDSEYILSALDGKLEEFLNEFVKTNIK